MTGPWSSRWVGTHLLLTEDDKVGNSWDNIPEKWKHIRFDCVDVLFISPIFINSTNKSIMISTVKDGDKLDGRFEWVVRAARSANPSVRIILEQFYGDCPGGSDFRTIEGSDQTISTFAMSVANFIEGKFNQTLPSIDGSTQVSARIDGYDVDVESGTLVAALPKILTSVRGTLNALGKKLGYRFSVSITPAWTTHLDPSIAQSCDYINMQNYSGGTGTQPEDYMRVVTGLQRSQLAWGLCSEEPDRNAVKTFAEAKAKAQEVINGNFIGTWTWRINSDNSPYENMFQLWLYKLVHGVGPADGKVEEILAKYWTTGGTVPAPGHPRRALKLEELQ